MNSNLALSLAHGTSVRVASARKPARARVLPARATLVRPVPRPVLAPSAGCRAEAVLMAAGFLALAGLAVVMEAVGVVTALVG